MSDSRRKKTLRAKELLYSACAAASEATHLLALGFSEEDGEDPDAWLDDAIKGAEEAVALLKQARAEREG